MNSTTYMLLMVLAAALLVWLGFYFQIERIQ
jgi:hypothetical protein